MTDDRPGILDDEFIKEMNKVDWHALSSDEAVQFGLIIGMLRDSIDETQRHVYVHRSIRVIMLASALTLCLGLMIGMSSTGLIGGLLSVMLAAYTTAWLRARGCSKISQTFRQSALEDITRLVVRHPKG